MYLSIFVLTQISLLAFQAQEDFTAAIKRDSDTIEAWKRRGQVRAAMGDHTAALDDFKEAKKLSSVISV